MAEEAKRNSPSSLKMFLYIVLGLALLSITLELTGIAEVTGKQEKQEIIDRPHD